MHPAKRSNSNLPAMHPSHKEAAGREEVNRTFKADFILLVHVTKR